MAVKFRLGLNIYDKTGKCPSCGKESDELGDHGMVCGTGGERISRQSSTTLSKTDTRLYSVHRGHGKIGHRTITMSPRKSFFKSSCLPCIPLFLISSTLAVAMEEVADLRGGIWLKLCTAYPLIIHFSHLPLY